MNCIEEMLSLAHALKSLTGCSDPVEIREAVDEWGGYPDDVSLTIDGEDWRFIRDGEIDQIMQDELAADPYILGCFNASFLGSVLGVDTAAIEKIQEADAYDGLGQMIISGGHVEELQRECVSADGYGHHFSHYDGSSHEFTWDGHLHHAFRVG